MKIKTRRMTPEQIEAALSHELEHVMGAKKGTDHPRLGLRCGGTISNMLTGIEPQELKQDWRKFYGE